jgi:hypothetical protein
VSTATQRRVTLAEVEQQARKDLAKGDPAMAVDWAFRHARAVARLAEAEQAWKTLDYDRTRLQIDVAPKYDQATLNLIAAPARTELEALTMVTASLHSAAADLGEARAIEAACAHVLRLLEKLPSRSAAPVAQAKPKAA